MMHERRVPKYINPPMYFTVLRPRRTWKKAQDLDFLDLCSGFKKIIFKSASEVIDRLGLQKRENLPIPAQPPTNSTTI